MFVTEWDDSIQNCGNGWVRTYRCPTPVHKSISICALYQDITKEIYSIPSVHRGERASHDIGPNQNNFYRTLQPNRTAWNDREIHSKSRTSRRRGKKVTPSGEFEPVLSIHFINCHRQTLVIVRQIVYNRLCQRPLGGFSISPSFSSFTRIRPTVHRR